MYMWIDKTEIEQRSLQVRQEHSIQTYGVKDIFSLIAQRGIHLIRYPFGKDKLLGFSTFFEGKKIIISNSSEILSREIFTIAHELGHVHQMQASHIPMVIYALVPFHINIYACTAYQKK
jgi:Zn-dependent peptidase ImmA (M78 family)